MFGGSGQSLAKIDPLLGADKERLDEAASLNEDAERSVQQPGLVLSPRRKRSDIFILRSFVTFNQRKDIRCVWQKAGPNR
jgi:hypothetical protein